MTDDGFVAAEVSGDGGMNWEAAGSPAWGGKPALAMDADTVLAAVVVRDDSLFCNWWNGEGDWNWGDEKLVFSAPAGVEFGHPSVALYPGKVGGVKVAAVTLCVSNCDWSIAHKTSPKSISSVPNRVKSGGSPASGCKRSIPSLSLTASAVPRLRAIVHVRPAASLKVFIFPISSF
uniref:Uncharacterized protein n=1 Tax=candidate division WOR-3 bacterium TaxID=2052148 RepID=A0A7C4GIY9_UNCW3